MRRLILAIAFACLAGSSLAAQVAGAPGRTTAAFGGSHGSSSFLLSGLSPITCSGATCSNTSSTVSPGSQVMSGTLTFNASHDLNVSIGGAYGGGAGLFQVSCNGGSTYLTIATGSGSIGSSVGYSYAPPSCTGVTNLNTLLFRTQLSGGGATNFNMSITPPSSFTIAW